MADFFNRDVLGAASEESVGLWLSAVKESNQSRGAALVRYALLTSNPGVCLFGSLAQ